MKIRSIVALALFAVVAGCGGSKNLGSKMDASDARPTDAGARDGQLLTDTAPGSDAAATDGRIPDGATPDVARDGAADKAVTDTRPSDAGDGSAPGTPDSSATPDTSAMPDTTPSNPADAPVATPDTAPEPDTAVPDTAEPDTAVDTAPAADTGSPTAIDAPVVTLCPGNIPLSAACGLYCAAITAGCTGLLAQFTSEAECVSICVRPTWPCGEPGERGNTLACRIAQLVPLATQPEIAPLACPNAGVNSLTCR